MSDTAFHFDIGKFRCLAVKDGTITDQSSPGRPVQVHHVNCLFVDTGKHKILVDTGCGEGFQPTAGRLLSNLKAEGIKPADIDRIVFTHGHLDHVGGAFDAAGEPVYPNARYLAAKERVALLGRPAGNERAPAHVLCQRPEKPFTLPATLRPGGRGRGNITGYQGHSAPATRPDLSCCKYLRGEVNSFASGTSSTPSWSSRNLIITPTSTWYRSRLLRQGIAFYPVPRNPACWFSPATSPFPAWGTSGGSREYLAGSPSKRSLEAD